MAENTEPGPDAAPAPAAQRWLARLALLLGLAAGVLLVLAALGQPGVLAVGVGGLAVMLAAVWWFLSRRGPLRWLAAALALAAPVTVIVVYARRDLVWQVALVAALWLAAVAAARAALARARPPARTPEQPAPPPRRPFVIMNPRSGGGKVGRFQLAEKATALGADVDLLSGPGEVDVAERARRAVADGADLLGVAGGDGTQALVAGVAAEHGLPFLVISAGTRNHFALDLGLDRERPDLGLDALTDGVEVRLDLGRIDGRTFVNNASFGAYAEVVQSPAYRDDKRGTTLQLLPDLLAGHRGPRLRVRIDGTEVLEAPTALLVSNNPYGSGDLAGLGRRPRLDGGVLGVVVLTVGSAAQAAGLLRGRRGPGLRTRTAHEVVVEADAPQIPVGVDGEALLLPTPVRCTVAPGALRVRLPRNRPGIPVPRPPLDRALLRQQALGTTAFRDRPGG
ncbi:diacylglycerol/lipid kinase family protein [Geodermatophilus ruber]|uniref:Diacylglycerol kinase family enzyme n=1 Tax=Geodermatophilus ruber TaxID=504800 RepID=A0A1I4A8B8_9ACTN|nr:diacylglycerol kinase family protein [Geodermatophilus ruber]SFK52420.1 Diacylglycerol kinase family enzyme [Geodermatophilus ruber]